MKNILCFGDSNTFGYDTVNDSRFSREIRWTGLIQKKLGKEYYVIEEGMGGRTTVWEDPIENLQSGKDYLLSCLESHWPLDLVIIMLGTNDLKARFGLSAYDIACGIETLVCMTKEFFKRKSQKQPEVLIVSPIEVDEEIVQRPYGIVMGGISASERSHEFRKYYSMISERNQCHFLAASEFSAPCKEDCIHLDAEGHRMLADALVEKIDCILNNVSDS